jgi:hypothetical protein
LIKIGEVLLTQKPSFAFWLLRIYGSKSMTQQPFFNLKRATVTRQLSIDELATRVEPSANSDYFLEAVKCFKAEAYRACIIMTSNAVFNAVRGQMNVLAEAKVARANKVVGEVNEAVSSGKTFEGALVTKLRETGVIPPDEIDALAEILAKRNHAAHPNNSDSKPQDAYYVVEKAVDIFLCRQATPFRFAVDTLVRDIYHDGFFTDNTMEDIGKKVREEMSKFEISDYYQIMNDLKKKLKEDKGHEDSKALWFLLGVLDADRPELHAMISKEFFAKKGFNPEHDAFLVDMCVVRPALLTMIDGENRNRLDHTFAKFTETLDEVPGIGEVRSPTAILLALIEVFGRPEVEGRYPKTVKAVLKRFWSHPELSPVLDTALRDQLLDEFLKQASSSEAANERQIADYLIREDAMLATKLTRHQIERIFEAIIKPEFRSQLLDIRNRSFCEIPRLQAVMASPRPAVSSSWRRPAPYLVLEGQDLVLRPRETSLGNAENPA